MTETYWTPGRIITADDKIANRWSAAVRYGLRYFGTPEWHKPGPRSQQRRLWKQLGYSPPVLRAELQRRCGMPAPWIADRMTLEHIVPCWTAFTVAELLTLFHWSNLTMLNYDANTGKGFRLPQPHEMPGNTDQSVLDLLAAAYARGAGVVTSSNALNEDDIHSYRMNNGVHPCQL